MSRLKTVAWFFLCAMIASFILIGAYGLQNDSTTLIKIVEVHKCTAGRESKCYVSLENSHRFTIYALVDVGDYARYQCHKGGFCYYDHQSFNMKLRDTTKGPLNK